MAGIEKKIKIPFVPQDYQLESLNHPARFKVIIRGRRGGKTEEELQGCIRDAVTMPGLHWIVGPSYRQIKSIAWTRLKAILKIDNLWKFNEQELYAEHPAILDEHGMPTRIELKGADKPDSLVGVGLRTLRVDEAALLRRILWENVLRPMLADHKAPATFYSTPRGRNYLYELFMRGQDKDDTEWMSWRQPTVVNEYISDDEIEEAKRDMSERLFNQEFMAEFLDDELGVFKGVHRCTVGSYEEPVEGRFYMMGVDLAKTHDFTVLTVMDTVTRHVVAWERFQELEWREQRVRIQKLAQKYNDALCYVDSTGVGDPIVEDLQNSGVSVEGIKFTNTLKAQMVDNLSMAIERRLVTWPQNEILTDELLSYEYKITNSGNITYNAPEGKFDDAVVSLFLVVWGMRINLHEAQQVVKDYEKVYTIRDRQGQGEPIRDLEDIDYSFGGY